MNFIRRNALHISAVFLLLLIFGLPSLFYPFGRDQGIHAQVGAAWLDGQLPYRDVWHPKGFLSFVPHALATAVFGHQMWGIRLADLIWQFASGLLIFLIGMRRMGKRGVLLAVGLYYFIYYAFGYWHTAQPEGFLTPFVLLAIWLYDRAAQSKRPRLHYILSGSVIALSPWFKQTAIVFILALFAWAFFDYWTTKKGKNKFALIFGGVLLTNGLILAFTAVTGMLNPMLAAFNYILFEYPNLGHAGLVEIIQLTGAWGIWFPLLIFPFLAGIGYLIFNRPLWPHWIGLVLMAFAGLAAVYIQRQLWLYHWVSSLPFLVLIGAFALESSQTFLWTLPQKKQQGVVWFFVLACLALALPVIGRHLANDKPVAAYLTGRLSETAFLETYELADVVETAEYLKTHTDEGEPIFIWGHYAMIYYLADQPNPTRFINDPPLSIDHSRRATWRRESIIDLAANPPAYIIVATNDTTSFEPQSSKEQLTDFTTLVGFMAAQYQLETIIGNFEIYTAVE